MQTSIKHSIYTKHLINVYNYYLNFSLIRPIHFLLNSKLFGSLPTTRDWELRPEATHIPLQ